MLKVKAFFMPVKMFVQACSVVFLTVLRVTTSTTETTSPSLLLVLDQELTDKNVSHENAFMTEDGIPSQNTSYSNGNVKEIGLRSEVSPNPKGITTPGGEVEHKEIVASCSDTALDFNSSLVLWEKSLRKCTKSGAFFDALKALLQQLSNEPVCRDSEASSLFFYCEIKKRHSECLQKREEDIKVSEAVLRMTRVMVERLCLFKELFQGGCLLERLDFVQSCIWTEVRSLMDMRDTRWVYGIVDDCRMSMLTKLCLWEELGSCGSDVQGKLAYSVFNVLSPPACDYPSSQSDVPYSFSISTCILVLSSVALVSLVSFT